MKLSKIYSNKNELFEPIFFNEGFNVIFGEIKFPEDEKKHSHNLGKSLLIDLIDFCFLKGITQTHFLRKHFDIFKDFIFYLEIKLNSGNFLTIRRKVNGDTKISFKRHNNNCQDFSNLSDEEWELTDISLNKAVDKLNLFLSFDVCSNWSYRKGIGYFLRTQKDYSDVFQISKYQSGEHKEWKPYLGKLLGFDDVLLKKKYDLEKDREKIKSLKNDFEEKLYINLDDYDKLKSLIKLKELEIKEISEKIDKFDFHEKEISINNDLVERVEKEISGLNNELYNIKFDMQKIEDSVTKKINFDLDKIKKIFEEVNLSFNESVTKDYEELVNFNQKILKERKKNLKFRLEELESEKNQVLKKLKQLNKKREENLNLLRQRDSFDKFKEFQKLLSKAEGEIQGHRNQLETLDKVVVLEKQIDDFNTELERISKVINEAIKKGTDIANSVKNRFSKIIKQIFFKNALLYLKINNEGNLEFKAEYIKDNEKMEETSESEGFTHKKLLCAAFDLSILTEYSKMSYFRFIYHDGMLEAVDPRKKIVYLNLVKEYCEKFNIQYILTAIDSDLPRDPTNDKIIQFEDREIILRLSDEGEKGRLFRIPTF